MSARREAHREGKVWIKLSMSGGKDTPLLGPTGIKGEGAKDPDTAFLIYMLFRGHTVKQAQAELKKAKKGKK